MTISMASLLVHSESVPADARAALRAALAAPLEERDQHLESAARILNDQFELECSDARELVGLPSAGACG